MGKEGMNGAKEILLLANKVTIAAEIIGNVHILQPAYYILSVPVSFVPSQQQELCRANPAARTKLSSQLFYGQQRQQKKYHTKKKAKQVKKLSQLRHDYCHSSPCCLLPARFPAPIAISISIFISCSFVRSLATFSAKRLRGQQSV